MTKNTPRDRVWAAALDLADEGRDVSAWNWGFTASEVLDRVDDPPSKRTVRDVLATMADLGHLERGQRRGEYKAVEVSFPPAEEESFRSEAGDDDDAGEEFDIASSGLSAAETDDVDDDLDVLDELEFPSTVDRDDAIHTILVAREYLEDQGQLTQREFVANVMPEHSLGYNVPTLEEGDRYRGAWWRRVVKPALEALDDVEKPPAGGSAWRIDQ